MVASYAISALLTPKQKIDKPKLSDFEFPQVDEGTPQAVVFGTAWTAGWQVLWYGNLHTTKVKSKVKKK